MFGWKSCKMTSAKVVLVACGSFNPVTNMHLRMFEIARDALNRTTRFQVVGGIMSPVSDAYKKKDLLPAKHRVAMARAALKTSDWIKLDTWESSQSAWSETLKVLRHFRQQMETQYGHKPSPSKRRRKQQNTDDEEGEWSGTCASRSDMDEDVSDLLENQIPKIEAEDEQVPYVKLLCGGDLLESFSVPGLWADDDVEMIVRDYGLVVITRAGSDPRKFIYESDVLSKYQENIFIVTEWIPQDISSTKIRRALRRGESVKYLIQDAVLDYIHEHRLYGIPDKTLGKVSADESFSERSQPAVRAPTTKQWDALRLDHTLFHQLVSLPALESNAKPRRECKVCRDYLISMSVPGVSKKPRAKEVYNWCQICKVPLCLEPCFYLFHNHQDYVTASSSKRSFHGMRTKVVKTEIEETNMVPS